MTLPPTPDGQDRPSEQEMAAAIKSTVRELRESNPLRQGALLPCSDLGNAKRLTLYEHETLRYVPAPAPDKGLWRVWDQTHWRTASDGELVTFGNKIANYIAQEVQYVPDNVRDQHMKWIIRSESAGANKALLSMAPGESSLWAPREIFDANPYLLNLANGTLDLSPGNYKFTAHDRWQYLTKICVTPYDPNATSPLVDSFLDRFLPDPAERHYILSVLAIASLVSGNAQRSLLMLLGPSTTGKTTLMSLIRESLGQDYTSAVNVSVFRGSMDDKPRPDILRALNARLMLAYEASDQWELHGDQVKRMTGEDPLTARGMHSNIMHEQIAAFTPIIVANETPKIKGADDGVRRRLRVMLMDQVVDTAEDTGQQRRALIGDLQARMAMIALLVRHFAECGGELPVDMPPRFVELTADVFGQLDDVDEILKDLIADKILVHDSGLAAYRYAKVSDLYRIYARRSHHSGNRNDVMGSKQFALRLRSLGLEIIRSNGMRVNGFRLTEVPLTDYL